MKVAIYALSKNESANVAAWESSCRDADVRVVTDTGSTDGTQDLLSDAGVMVPVGSPVPWRWDDAHNLSLMHVPDDIDVCIRLDLDEVIDPGWREALEAAWTPETTKLRYWYHWSTDLRFLCDRIHTRHGYRWQGATHEGLVRWSGDEVQTRCDTLAIRHHRQPDKQHKTDLTLLQQAVRENPLDSRMAWYLARELDYAGDDEAADAFKRYLRMAGGSPTERAAACRVLARLDKEHANRHLLASMLESPLEPEAYVMLVNMAWQMGDSVGALYWARQAKRCHPDNMTHASVPAAYGDATMAIGASAAMAVGLQKEALDFAREAFRRNPADRQHAANVAALAELQDEEGPKP